MADGEQIVIVGGGLAGLAAAAALGERGLPVTLLESRPRLGGRASSFVDQTTGAKIDNCQHVSMGCCTNFDHFCRTVGIADLLHTAEALTFIGPEGDRSRFAASAAPAPLHLAAALWRLGFLSRREKIALIRGLRQLIKTPPSEGERQTMADWLPAHGQSPRLIDRFWHVVLVSALSESLARINVAAARKVFADGFVAHRRGWEVRIPTVPLDTLYGETLTRWLTDHGVTVRLKAGVKFVEFDHQTATGVRLRDETVVAAEDVILAVPADRMTALLPADVAARPEFAAADELQTAPISSVHLWFDRPITDLPHAVLVDRLSQWLFSRGPVPAPDDAGSGESWHYYQVVISASHALAGRAQAEVIADVVRELMQIFPDAESAALQHSRLVTEHKAVLSMAPGVDTARPTQQTTIANLQLAGDWTATGWPSTMEGAVRSGYLAAEHVLRRRGRVETLVQSDLPVGVLSKFLYGL